MIVFVTVQRGTLKDVLAAAAGLDVRVLPYTLFFRAKELPRATYVFTDMERLAPRDLRIAADIYRRIRAAGWHTLNDPARVRSRFGLLRALHAAGINRFNAYRVEEGVKPERWPVFLRHEGTHDGPFNELLPDWDAVARAVDAALGRGIPLPALLITEYAAEPVRPGLFRKLASFRLGDAAFAHTCVHDDHWIAKRGKQGIATDELYREELRIAREDPYGPQLKEAFRLAGLEYGRADFGLVGGEVQVYEINSNPEVKFPPPEHPSPHRNAAVAAYQANFIAALRALDTPHDGASIPNDSPLLAPLRMALVIESHNPPTRQA